MYYVLIDLTIGICTWGRPTFRYIAGPFLLRSQAQKFIDERNGKISS